MPDWTLRKAEEAGLTLPSDSLEIQWRSHSHEYWASEKFTDDGFRSIADKLSNAVGTEFSHLEIIQFLFGTGLEAILTARVELWRNIRTPIEYFGDWYAVPGLILWRKRRFIGVLRARMKWLADQPNIVRWEEDVTQLIGTISKSKGITRFQDSFDRFRFSGHVVSKADDR